MLAVVCFYVFRESPVRQAVTPNYRVGAYYLAGALLCLALAASGWPWTGLLLWPAISLGITASAYCGIGPGIYRKNAGRIPLSARLALGPTLVGHWVSLCYYRRQCDPWNQVTPRVWIGASLNARQAREAKRQGVAAVLDLTSEFSETREFLEVNYLNIPILDLTGLPGRQLAEAVEFITKHAEKGVVYVHCKIGYSRSAAAVGAYLLASGRAAAIEESLTIQRNARPKIVFRTEVVEALKEFLQRKQM